MTNQKEVLIRLQSVFDQFRKLNLQKEYRLNDIEETKKLLQQKKDILAKEKDDHKSFQMKIDNKDVDLKVIEDHINNVNIKLNQIKTNKEYSAIKAEIILKEQDKLVLEDEILKLMDDSEKKQDKLNRLKDEIKKEEDKLSDFIKTVESDIKCFDEDIKEIEKRKKGLLEILDKDSRYHFERLIKNKDGKAVANVIMNVCQSCDVTVTPQTMSMLLGNDLVFCLSCGRILYLDKAEYAYQK